MMNLDFLFSANSNKYDHIAFKHAKSTLKNHYFYLDDDIDKQRPISYHLVDYGNMKPGNWQGLGAVSAWSRGQAWSFYGFVTVVEAARKGNLSSKKTAEFDKHLDKLFTSVYYLLKDGYVPFWDFLAANKDAYNFAENIDDSNTVYSKILDLCVNEIPAKILPNVGYRPIELKASLLSENAIEKLKMVNSIKNEVFIEDKKFFPCGNKPYDLTGRKIPRDSSASAILASAVYRLAQITRNKIKRKEYTDLADNIMASATSNLPSASEIDTSIVYADFYFVEANIRKLALEYSFLEH